MALQWRSLAALSACAAPGMAPTQQLEHLVCGAKAF
jgi:hypothetical protein